VKNQLASALDSAKQEEQRLLDTYDDIIAFGERWLSERPEELNALLKLVRDPYGDYLSRHRSDAQFDRQSAQILTSLARITDLSGSRASALGRYEQALDLWTQLAENAPDDLTLQAALADTWHEIGDLRNGLGRQDAVTAFQKAREIREGRLVKAAPDKREYLSALARSHGYIGDWERENGRREAARESYDEALEIRKGLSNSDPTDPAAKFQLARSYNNGGYLARETGDLLASIAEHSEAEKLQVWLAALNPDEARQHLNRDRRNVIQFRDFLGDLALTYNALGVATAELGDTLRAKGYQIKALSSLGDLALTYNAPGVAMEELGDTLQAQAEGYQTKARYQFDRLVKDFPGVNRYAGYQAWTRVYLAEIADPDQAPTALSHLDEADKVFDRLREDDSDVLRFRAGAARSWAVRGEILKRTGETKSVRDEGDGYLRRAQREQLDLVNKSRHNFDFNMQLEQTKKALKP
jgi:tetratricopeptide (TPR) repeat protein